MVRLKGQVAATAVLLWLPLLASADDVYVVCDSANAEAVVMTGDVGEHPVLAGPFPGPRTARIWLDESCPGVDCVCGGDSGSDGAGVWKVVCNTESRNVGLDNAPLQSGFVQMAGPFATYDAASSWVSSSCPSWRCDDAGSCAAAHRLEAPDYRRTPALTLSRTGSSAGGVRAPQTTGWVAGPVSTGPEGRAGGGEGNGWVAGDVRTGPGGGTRSSSGSSPVLVGPQAAAPDLTPLVDAANLAVLRCSYRAALANADQMATLEPDNPWLVANHDRLRHLASRQQTTEQMVWRASRLLEDGNLKKAREATHDAAELAVSCQLEAVSGLLVSIDQAIEQDRAAKDAARRRAAGKLLAGLLVLNQAATSEYSATGEVTSQSLGIAAVKGVSLALGGPDDPCTFQYQFTGRSVEPVCTCAGYRYDPGQLRCVGPGG